MINKISTLPLLAHIRRLNAKTQAWVDESPDTRMAGMIVEDLSHWHNYGIYTPEEFDHYLLVCAYSDMYKSLFGVRPRGELPEDLEAEVASLSEMIMDREAAFADPYSDEYLHESWDDVNSIPEPKEPEEFPPTHYEEMALNAGYEA